MNVADRINFCLMNAVWAFLMFYMELIKQTYILQLKGFCVN